MAHISNFDEISYKMTHSFLGGYVYNTKKIFQESQIGSPPPGGVFYTANG